MLGYGHCVTIIILRRCILFKMLYKPGLDCIIITQLFLNFSAL